MANKIGEEYSEDEDGVDEDVAVEVGEGLAQ